MVDDTRVAAAFSRLVLVGKVGEAPGNIETAGGKGAGGGGGEVGAGDGVAPREFDWLAGSGDGLASGTAVLLRSTCGSSIGQTLPSEGCKRITRPSEMEVYHRDTRNITVHKWPHEMI